MQVQAIPIHAGGIEQPYTEVGEISVKVQAATLFSKTPTIEDVNFKLQEKASQIGANAVLNVVYDRGMSLTSYKVLWAKGLAVIVESDEVKCPFCAESIKRDAKLCKHCRSDLSQTTAS